jgi:hypothetical protein
MDDPIKKDERDKRRRDRELNDIRKSGSSVEVRRLLWRVIEKARTHHISFVAGMADVTAFNEGARNVGNWLWSEILEADPGIYVQMQREHKSEAKREEFDDEEREKKKDILTTTDT